MPLSFFRRRPGPGTDATRIAGAGKSGGVTISIYSIQGSTQRKNTSQQSDTFDLVLGIFIVGLLVAVGTMWNPGGIADREASWLGQAARAASLVHPQSSQPQPAGIDYRSDVDVPPAAIRIVPAALTEQARLAHFHGTASMVVYVDAMGTAREMEPASPVPFGLGNAIRLAVFQWRFRPAQRGGVAVAAKTAVEVPFQ